MHFFLRRLFAGVASLTLITTSLTTYSDATTVSGSQVAAILWSHIPLPHGTLRLSVPTTSLGFWDEAPFPGLDETRFYQMAAPVTKAQWTSFINHSYPAIQRDADVTQGTPPITTYAVTPLCPGATTRFCLISYTVMLATTQPPELRVDIQINIGPSPLALLSTTGSGTITGYETAHHTLHPPVAIIKLHPIELTKLAAQLSQLKLASSSSCLGPSTPSWHIAVSALKGFTSWSVDGPDCDGNISVVSHKVTYDLNSRTCTFSRLIAQWLPPSVTVARKWLTLTCPKKPAAR